MPLSPDLTGVVWGQVDDDPDVFRGPVGLATDAGVAGPFVLIDDDYLDYGKGSGEVVLFGGIEDEEEDDDVTTVDEVVVTGELRDRTSPSIVGGGGGGGLVIGGSGDGNDVDPVPPPPSDPISEFFDWITEDARNALRSLLERFGDTATDLAQRDDNTNFDRSRTSPLYGRDGQFVGYVDNTDPRILWLDRNGNGQPETLLRYYPNGEIWQDTDFNGSWDRRVR